MSAPIYKLVMTNLGGEQRFAAAVARRLQSLGALTRGDRRAASGVDLSESNFDSPLGRKSLRSVLYRIYKYCFMICFIISNLTHEKSGLVKYEGEAQVVLMLLCC